MKKILLLLFSVFALNVYSQSNIELSLYATGFDFPLYITNDGINPTNGINKLYAVEQGGRIKILLNGQTNTAPFLDISTMVSNGNEQGLLGLAFHPNYEINGHFFVNYTNTNGDTQISRFSVNNTNPDIADSSSELPILTYTQPFGNHNGGHLAFGPDGYLYISSGDGGASGDPQNRAQNKNTLLGKLLRIDVDNPTGGNNYGIPADNPFLGDPNAKKEIWAYGLRNPWRFSFDFNATNYLWIADVGQGNIEEINKVNATEAGLNYGWRCYEGSAPFNTQNCPPQSELTFPISEYTHASGNCSITGGYVYRGNAMSNVYNGYYFFADYCSGKIAALDPTGQLAEEVYFTGKNWVSFGESYFKELYIVDGPEGSIYSIESVLSTPINALDKILNIFPNPASNKIFVSLGQSKLQKVQIFDIRGGLIYTEENILADKKEIDISSLSAGIYFAKITSEKEETVVKKLIIQ